MFGMLDGMKTGSLRGLRGLGFRVWGSRKP